MADREPQHEYEVINHTDKKKWKCTSSRFCLFLLVVSVVFNIVLIVVLIAMKMTTRDSEHHDIETPHQASFSGPVCVSCDSLQGSNDVITESASYVTEATLDQNYRLCCLKHSEGLSRLLSVFVNEQHTNSHISTSDAEFKARPFIPTSAHMYVNLTSLENSESDLFWSTEPGLGTAHISGGITYKNGRYVIPQDGLYNVYSFLTSETGDAVSVDIKLVHAVSRLRRREDGKEKQVLLVDKMSRLDRSGVFSTSYLSASLKLQKNDEIYVEFSNKSLIYNFAPANYFGIYML